RLSSGRRGSEAPGNRSLHLPCPAPTPIYDRPCPSRPASFCPDSGRNLPLRSTAMAEDQIRYDLLAQAALRSVVRSVLADVAKKGLPGDHHFFISFATRAEGVQISPRMLAQYPEEMTIVLQHQFWDLTVADDRFQVGLSFGGVPERLTVPFAAL